ncbi:unnamed protein product, partial [Rotaria sp. Silwood1]
LRLAGVAAVFALAARLFGGIG